MIPRQSLINIWTVINKHRFQIFLLFVTVFLPLVVFGKLADEVLEREPMWFDDRISYLVHAHATPIRDTFMQLMSKLGYEWGVVPACVGILAVLILQKQKYDALFFSFSVGGAAVLNRLAKLFFERERPSLWLTLAPEKNYSFPSGHAMGSMAFVAAVIILLWPTKWRYPSIFVGGVFVFLVSFSRIYLGVHYPSDIVAGVAAALIWVTGISIIFYKQIGKTISVPASE